MNFTTEYALTPDGTCVETETGRVVDYLIVNVQNATTKDGRSFTAFKAVKYDTRYIDLRFSREATDNGEVPTGLKPGYYAIVVDYSDIRIDRNRVYPCAYVGHCKGVLPFNGVFVTNFMKPKTVTVNDSGMTNT